MQRLRKVGLAIVIIVVLIISLLFFTERAGQNITKNHAGICTRINPTTVELSGKVDQSMRDCALSMLTENVTNIYVDSPGEDAVYGRAIGHKIGEIERTMHVENYCGSSCANYFIPAVSKLSLTENAVIMLHGSPDPFTAFHPYRNIDKTVFMEEIYGNIELLIIDENGELMQNPSDDALLKAAMGNYWKGDPLNPPSTEEIGLRYAMEQQSSHTREEEKFAKKFAVPLGWRMYRDENSTTNGWLEHFNYTQFTETKSPYLRVETPMIESCLPKVELLKSQSGKSRSIFEKIALNISHSKSQDLRCAVSK